MSQEKVDRNKAAKASRKKDIGSLTVEYSKKLSQVA